MSGEAYNTKTSPNSPSLDRIHNGTTLELDSIQVLCHQCNLTKGYRSMEEFYEYCEFILSRRDLCQEKVT